MQQIASNAVTFRFLAHRDRPLFLADRR